MRAQALDCKEPEHADFWGALAVVAEAEVAEAARQDEADRARLRGERNVGEPDEAPPREAGLNAAVDTDIHLLLAGALSFLECPHVCPRDRIRCVGSCEALSACSCSALPAAFHRTVPTGTYLGQLLLQAWRAALCCLP
jgi:hypothetical protein